MWLLREKGRTVEIPTFALLIVSLAALALTGCDAKKSEAAPSSAASVATESAVPYPSMCDKLGASTRWHVEVAGFGFTEEAKSHVIDLSEGLNLFGMLKSVAVETQKGSFSVISVEQYATCEEAEAAGLDYEKKYSIIKIKLDTRPVVVEDIKRELVRSGKSKHRIPMFLAACSKDGVGSHFRLVSNPLYNDIYFASILDTQSIKATMRGKIDKFNDDFYFFSLSSGEGIPFMAELWRKSGKLHISRIIVQSKVDALSGAYTCKRVYDHNEYLQTLGRLISGWLDGEYEAIERKRALENRPNQF